MMSSSGSTNKSGAAVVEEEEDATQPRLEESPSVPTVSQSNQSSTDKSNISYKKIVTDNKINIMEKIIVSILGSGPTSAFMLWMQF